MKPKKKICDRCQKDRYIWKNVSTSEGRMKLCQTCYNIWSAQTNPEKKQKKTVYKPIRPRSIKRQKQEAQYSKLRKVYMEEHPHCMAVLPNVCTYHATDVHHKDGRIEDQLTNEADWIAVCRACHKWIHAHPREARELNLLI